MIKPRPEENQKVLSELSCLFEEDAGSAMLCINDAPQTFMQHQEACGVPSLRVPRSLLGGNPSCGTPLLLTRAGGTFPRVAAHPSPGSRPANGPEMPAFRAQVQPAPQPREKPSSHHLSVARPWAASNPLQGSLCSCQGGSTSPIPPPKAPFTSQEMQPQGSFARAQSTWKPLDDVFIITLLTPPTARSSLLQPPHPYPDPYSSTCGRGGGRGLLA